MSGNARATDEFAQPPPPDLDRWRQAAREALRLDVWDYIEAGAGWEWGVRENVEAWTRYRLRPHVLRDVAKVTTAATLLGETVACPVGVAPTGRHELVHPGGEAASAAGAADADAVFILSFFSNQPLEQVAAIGRGVRWLQLPINFDQRAAQELGQRAGEGGFRALVMTVDQPVSGHSPRASANPVVVPERHRHALLPGAPKAVIAFDAAFMKAVPPVLDCTFDDVARFAEACALPVVVKGVLRGDDAARCIAAGARAVIVSNHGARHLDGTIAPADALSEVVDAVGEAGEVYADGGIRSGVDVLRARALGARAVFVGRPPLWGLAAAGRSGVRDVLVRLRHELRTAMVLAGLASLDAADRDLIAAPAEK